MWSIQHITHWQDLLLHCLDSFPRIYELSWHWNHGVCSLLWVSYFIITFILNLKSLEVKSYIITLFSLHLLSKKPSSIPLPPCSLSTSWPLFCNFYCCWGWWCWWWAWSMCVWRETCILYTHKLKHTHTNKCEYTNTICSVWIILWPLDTV